MKHKYGLFLASLWLAVISFGAQAQLPSNVGGQPIVSLAPLVDKAAPAVPAGQHAYPPGRRWASAAPTAYLDRALASGLDVASFQFP